jgi:hypothetical protein
MKTPLARFQDEFAAALYGAGDFAPARRPGFRVHRNNVITACIDALRANFPSVERLVGEEWFRDAAGLYARRHPPVEASLLRYAERMPGFLAGIESAAGLPYLAGVAQLDLLWIQAHAAADDAVLAPEQLEARSPHELGGLHLRPHASARWAWFDEAPVYTIWDANRRASVLARELEWRGEGALLVRRAGEVTVTRLERGACAFLDACRDGLSLAEASAAAGTGAAAATQFAALLAAGALAASSP